MAFQMKKNLTDYVEYYKEKNEQLFKDLETATNHDAQKTKQVNDDIKEIEEILSYIKLTYNGKHMNYENGLSTKDGTAY